MSEIKTDVLIIGAGPGGYTAAFEAAKEGFSVTLVDKEADLGGVCLSKGCIPSKSLLHIAKLLNEVKEAKEIGIDFGTPNINLDTIRNWKNSVIEKLSSGLASLSKKHNINFICGKASFASSNSVNVEKSDGTKAEIKFNNAIIATGSIPISLDFAKESARIINSKTALDIENIPSKLLVVGGGYIGLELGTVYAALGSKISVVEMTSSILPEVDKDLVSILQKRLKNTFESIKLDTKVTAIDETQNGVTVTFEERGGKTSKEDYDQILVAVGRSPSTEGLALSNTKVETGKDGSIKINSMNQTTDKNIYAVGDISGNPMLAHKATPEGRNAVKAIKKQEASLGDTTIPYVVFTDPEIAFCGLTETQAKEKGKDIKVSKFHWMASGRAMTLNRTDGVTKLIIEPKTDRILGVAIAGVGAGELISEGVLAIETGTTADKLKRCIHPHPTLSETIMDAAENSF